MIPRAEILAVAEELGLLPTTIEKDYMLGWVLFGIARHPELSHWFFKEGTCLKKCYFDTYRFSEDLDFTVPPDTNYDADAIRQGLAAVTDWIRDESGIDLPSDGLDVEESVNKRGERTFTARTTFVGPLQLPRAQRQRIRFDLTSDEIVVEGAELRSIAHGYSDAPASPALLRCYTLNEILAEKMRALHQRAGRARDVYDVVNVGRNFRADVSRERVRTIAVAKFRLKSLGEPDPGGILNSIDPDVLAADWGQALRHQLVVLPPLADFLTALREVLEWLLEPTMIVPALPPVAGRAGESAVPRVAFGNPLAARTLGSGARVHVGATPREAYGSRMDRLRFAARNRLLAHVSYHGVQRVVEPYSLRMPKTGNLLLYVHEVARGSGPGEGTKAYKVAEIAGVELTDQPFQARYLVEL